MKVAQQFIAGLAFFKPSRPVRDDRVSFAPAKLASKVVCDHFLSSLAGRTNPLDHQPSNKLLGYFH
jgi:hypothetical protein